MPAPHVFISTGAGSSTKPAIVDAETGDVIAIATSPANAARIAEAMNR